MTRPDLLVHGRAIRAVRPRPVPLWRRVIDPLLEIAAVALTFSLIGWYAVAGVG